MPRGTRHPDADGVGGKPAVAPAVGSDERRVAGHVHEVHRDEPRRYRHLRVGADAPEVMDIAKRRHHRPELAGALDEALHHLRADPLAESETSVELHHRAPVPDQGQPGVRVHRPVGDVLNVMRNEPDAVAVVAAQIRVDEVVGDLGGLGGLAPGPLEEGPDHAPQLDIREAVHGGAHSSLTASCTDARRGRSIERWWPTAGGRRPTVVHGGPASAGLGQSASRANGSGPAGL